MAYQNIIKTEQEYKTIKKAAEISVEILKELRDFTVEGISPNDVNEKAKELLAKYRVKSSFKHVPGPIQDFPAELCLMVNDETVHNIPFSKIPLTSGDIVKIDMGIVHDGFNTDHGITIGIGEISKRHQQMIDTVKLSVETALKFAMAGGWTGDISFALGETAALGNFSSVEGFCGHGIGRNIHYAINIPFFGKPGTGIKLEENMALCIENWITDGNASLYMEKDGWTLRTRDGSTSAMWEHMVIVRKGKVEVLTEL